MHRTLATAVILFAGTVSTVGGEATERRRVFTAAQAEAGRVEMQNNSFGACTSCHTTTLSGRKGDANELPTIGSLPADYQRLIYGNGGRVPALAGPDFVARWSDRTTREITAEFQMRFAPPSGRLSEETRLNLIAYMLHASGAAAGTEPLTMATDVALVDVLNP